MSREGSEYWMRLERKVRLVLMDHWMYGVLSHSQWSWRAGRSQGGVESGSGLFNREITLDAG